MCRSHVKCQSLHSEYAVHISMKWTVFVHDNIIDMDMLTDWEYRAFMDDRILKTEANHSSQLLACRSLSTQIDRSGLALQMPLDLGVSKNNLCWLLLICLLIVWPMSDKPSMIASWPSRTCTCNCPMRYELKGKLHVSAAHRFISQLLQPVKLQLQTSTSAEQFKFSTYAKNGQLLFSCTGSAIDLLWVLMAIRRLLMTHMTSNVCMGSVINQLLST